jgi:hypothetical protein
MKPQKIINRIRRKPRPQPKPEHPLVKIIAEHKAEIYMSEFWERDKKIVRDYNFKKALIGLREYRKGIEAEKERQEIIADQRLKNLKKARRKLARMRSVDE